MGLPEISRIHVLATTLLLPEASDGFFLPISTQPRPRTASFHQFLLNRGLGRPLFANFYSTEASDGLFSPISTQRRPTKASFCQFLCSVGLRKPLSANFCATPYLYRPTLFWAEVKNPRAASHPTKNRAPPPKRESAL